jgi:hypothetical protein
MILEGYPENCIEAVTDTRTGVQSKAEFLTLVALKKACDAFMLPIWQREAAIAAEHRQLEERRRLEGNVKDPRVVARILAWQKGRKL